MTYSIDDLARDYAKKAQDYDKRGDNHQKQGNYKESLEEYAQSLNYYAKFLQFSDRNFIRYEKTNPSRNYGLDTQVSVLIWLGILLTKIETCYSQQQEYAKVAVFIENLKELVKVLGKFKNSFDGNVLKTYEKLAEGTRYAEATVSLRSDQSEFETQSNPSDDSDATFKKLCLEFDRCCSYEICPLPSRGVDENSSSSNSNISQNRQSSGENNNFIRIVAAIFFPPLGLWLTVGFGFQFWANLALLLFLGSLNVGSNPIATVGACILALSHAIWVILNHDRS
ncbi:YqaE/Pmp3 family membrane protein [Limnoraphis robusta]|uniref:YqaE/Pmp3 family membrane protein n=1 Tax=Limnoraphis robusta CCNP1315 TaxID=3110306 RepID=A0ABU5U099_9CYAN|nr:YqaE/Pmp3 family membrane protein [Limnoraphis robusta]MEA5520614.1 YqaE/Pmp3 family membrane protein [Limnoraphis robusta CCNP1315]MEA5548866.1 YqaE/Pmp3 family membrane protein [Limnoraphis robusta CCNP1324]